MRRNERTDPKCGVYSIDLSRYVPICTYRRGARMFTALVEGGGQRSRRTK